MNNKRIAVLLATLMAVSMIAMGFVGTAAASPADDEDFEGFVAANEADADEEDANHVVTINTTDETISEGDLGDGEIEITYDEGDDDELDASDISDASSITVDVIESDGSAIASDLSLDDADGTSSGEITIDFESGLNGDLSALSDDEIEEGDLIRIAIEGEDIDHNNDGEASFDVDVDVQDDGDSTLTEQIELPLELPGPVENIDDDTTYYSVASAVADAGPEETVEVDLDDFDHDELDQLLTQEGALGGTVSEAVDPIEFDSETGIALEGEDTPTVISTADDGNGDEIVALGDDEQSIEDIEFVGEGFLDDTASDGIDVDDNNEVTLEDVEVTTVEGTAIVGTTVGDLTLDGVTVDSESDGLSITNVDDGDVDVEGTEFENVGDNTAIGVADVDGEHFVNVTDSTEITGLDGSSAVGIDVDASDDDAVVNIEDVTEIGVDGGDATAIVTDADDAGAEININNTDVDGYAEADDVGIELNGGDKDAGDELDVFIGEDTDVTGANTSVDVNFDASTENDDAILTIDDAEFTLEGDGEDVTAIDADESGLEDGTYVISIEGEGVEINGDADTTGIHANDGSGDIELSVDEAHEDASEINDVGTGIHVESVSEITGDQITNTSFDGVAATALDIEDDNDGLTLGDITVEDSTDATAVDYSAGQDLDLEESELGTQEGDGVDTGLSVTDVDELTVTQEDNAIWLAEDATAGIHVDDDGSGEIEIENVAIVGFDGDEADSGIHIEDADDNVKFDHDVDQAEASLISAVEDGVVITDDSGTIEVFDIANTTFEHIGSEGEGVALQIDDPDAIDDDELKVEDIDISDSEDATGVDIDATGVGSDDVELTGSSIQEVADGVEIEVDDGGSNIDVDSSEIDITSADGVGLNIDSASSAGVITVEDNVFSGDSEATAIEVDENDGDYEIHFNDFDGFTGDEGYALAGDEVGELDQNDANANWYGTEYGPHADAGSNVDLDDEPEQTNIYEPFLTSEDELDTADTSDVTEFGYSQVVDGNFQTFAVPTISQNYLDDMVEDGDLDGVLYVWDDEEQQYTTVDAEEFRPALDAMVVSLDGDAETAVLNEFGSEPIDGSPAPSAQTNIEDGLNFVPAATGASDIDDRDDALAEFGVSTDSTGVNTVTTTSAYTTADFDSSDKEQINIAETTSTDGWDKEDVSPFIGYEVVVDGDASVGTTQTSVVDAGSTLDEAQEELGLD